MHACGHYNLCAHKHRSTDLLPLCRLKKSPPNLVHLRCLHRHHQSFETCIDILKPCKCYLGYQYIVFMKFKHGILARIETYISCISKVCLLIVIAFLLCICTAVISLYHSSSKRLHGTFSWQHTFKHMWKIHACVNAHEVSYVRDFVLIRIMTWMTFYMPTS